MCSTPLLHLAALALHMGMAALGIGFGDEVIWPIPTG